MRSSTRSPTRFPVGSKYILEARGPFVRRYIEFPNGRRVQLATRKALSCTRVARQQVGIIPDQSAADVDGPSQSKRLATISA